MSMDIDQAQDGFNGDPEELEIRLFFLADAEYLRRSSWPARSILRSGPGNSRTIQASRARWSCVIKTGADPAVSEEGYALQRIWEDERLPQALREAVPEVYAVGSVGPLHGYAMEEISSPSLARFVLDEPDHAVPAVAALWEELLEGAYRSTRTDSAPVDHHRDRIVRGLEAAVSRVPMLDGPIVIEDGRSGRVLLPPWRDAIDRLQDLAPVWAPPFATWVHGNLSARTILIDWRPTQAVRRLRVISPKPVGTGDYIADIANLSMSLRVAPVDEGRVLTPFATAPRLRREPDRTLISYRFEAIPRQLLAAQTLLAKNAARFAAAHGDAGWKNRYRLLVGLRLLGMAASRLAQEDSRSRRLGVAAFCEGLSAVTSAVNRAS